MPFWNKIAKAAGGSVGDMVTSTAKAIERFTGSEGLKHDQQIELRKMLNDFALQVQSVTTERQKIDMQSDSWLSKNIRPMLLLWALMMVTISAFTDGTGDFDIKPSYIDLMGNVLEMGIAFYFGSRLIEKVNDRREKRREKEIK